MKVTALLEYFGFEFHAGNSKFCMQKLVHNEKSELQDAENIVIKFYH